MLIALGGVIAGYDGSFSFEKIGVEYPNTVPYVALRLVSCSDLFVTTFLQYLTLFVFNCIYLAYLMLLIVCFHLM